MQPYHQRETRQRTLTPMYIAETATEDLPRLAAALALSSASEALAGSRGTARTHRSRRLSVIVVPFRLSYDQTLPFHPVD
jgi:hypothetical protein